jgi:hypothetical protein
MSSDVTFDDTGASMHLTLMANPSHLEAVNPVVLVPTAVVAWRATTDRLFCRVKPVLSRTTVATPSASVSCLSCCTAMLPSLVKVGVRLVDACAFPPHVGMADS